MKFVYILVVLGMLSGCVTTKNSYQLDGATAQSVNDGISHLMAKLSEPEKTQLALSLVTIQLAELNNVWELAGKKSLQLNYQFLSKKIDGLNYYQILELARVTKERVKTN